MAPQHAVASTPDFSRELRALLLSGPTRLAFVYRCSGSMTLRQENNAEHSWMVAIYGVVIGTWHNDLHHQQGPQAMIDIGRVALLATLHDVEEAVSGDFPRPFKYSSPQLLKMLNEAGAIAFGQVFERCLPPEGIRILHNLWANAKNTDTMEGRLVRFCDFLAVVAVALREGIQNNPMLREHMCSMPEYSRTFNDPTYDFIRPWVSAAQEEVERAWGLRP